MPTREKLRPVEVRARAHQGGRLFAGLGQTTVMAASALVGCALLITFGATLSVCWAIHPLLSAVTGLVLVWLTARVAYRLLWSSSRQR
jgi:hypothetical protein